MTHFDPNDLLADASKATGLTDFGPDDFREAFLVLVEGLNKDAGIAADRHDHLYKRLQRLLINRLWFAKDLTEHPEILDEDLRTPVVISSLPRTGSTKLHRMLAATGDFQTLPFWQVNMPSRIPGEPDGGVDKRIAQTRAYEKWMYEVSPDVLTGHPMFTEAAEEDQWLMEQSFRHPVLFGLFESSHYLQWLMQADMAPSFSYLKSQLKYLQWQFRQGEPKPWLLKSPTHFGSEQALQGIFASMKIITTHRHPARCMPSIASTAMAARKIHSDKDSRAEMAPGLIGMFSMASTAHMAWRDANPAIPLLDIGFSDVRDDGISVAGQAYDFLGMKLSDDAIANMRQWEADNTREKHGRASYTLEEYQMNEDVINQAFAQYIDRFSDMLA